MRLAIRLLSDWRVVIAGLLFFLIGTATPGEEHVFYGLLHAHTMFSDGSGTPAEAYKAAKEAGCDFFAVTEHNHAAAESGAKERRDGVLIATNHDLYDSNDELDITRTLGSSGHTHTENVHSVSLMRAAKEAMSDKFVAIYGQEFSTISSSNHANVLNYDKVIETPNGDFRGLYGLMAGSSSEPIVQLNHPDVHSDLFYHGQGSKKNMKNDYGIDDGDLGPSFAEFVKVSDPYVSLLEVLSGPAMKKSRINHYHYTDSHQNDYFFYLCEGLHISPSAGQDNHYPTWGSITDARTGIICSKLTKDEVMSALRERHTFATEDKNLNVRLHVNGVTMGDNLMAESETELKPIVDLADSDESDSDYEVTLIYGDVRPESRDSATEWKEVDGVQEKLERHGNGSVEFKGYVASGRPEFFYVKVEQSDGDRAWTAAVWINYPKPPKPSKMFVWSANSRTKVYHRPDCKWAARIAPANRKEGSQPPEGWHQHDCVVEADVEEGH